MLDEVKIRKIKNRLDKWCQERKLTLKQQQDEYLVKILEEIKSFILAVTDEERIEKLCNIAIFSLNTIEVDKIYYDHLNDNKFNKSIGHIVEILGQDVIDRASIIAKHTLDNKNNEEYCAIAQILKICDKMANELGFNFYLCLSEKINELENCTGKWNDKTNSFEKDCGAFDYEEAEQTVKEYCILPPKTYEYLFFEQGYYVFKIYEEDKIEEFKVKNLYASDFKKCKIEDFNKDIFINELSDYFRNTLNKAFVNFIPNQKIQQIIPLIDMEYLSEASFTVLMNYSDFVNTREDNVSDYNPNLAIRICDVKIDNFKEIFPYSFILDHYYNKDRLKEELFIELICSNENFDEIQEFIIELRDYVLKNQDKVKIPLKKSNAKSSSELQEEFYVKFGMFK